MYVCYVFDIIQKSSYVMLHTALNPLLRVERPLAAACQRASATAG